ncbi:MAG: molybdopterin-dependent oxidoreductase [Spirochaetales bacterium]|nr:molybdopterin-dependent oxidoreductase [Spirochaetales bacterium]
MKNYKYVGQKLPEVHGFAKVSGRARFSDDLKLPGMLYARLLRSPHAHARIQGIDVSRALEVPGVVTILTGADTPINFLAQIPDMPPLCRDKVRYVGDPVAAVAAETMEAASAALRLIEVDYEPLPAYLDPEAALADGAGEIHEGKSNLMLQLNRDFGDVDKAFAEADRIFEDEFSTQAVSHGNLEPRCSVAQVTPDGILEIWSGTQSPYFVRKEVANVCNLPLSRVRVMPVFSGGGFGGRSKYCEDEGVTALLALRTGRPVKTTFSREEELTVTRIRHPFRMKIKTGVRKDGTLLARQMEAVVDKGAYCHYGIGVVGYSGGIASSLYRVPNFRYRADIVYTNKEVPGPFRGFGAPQVNFPIDVQLDRIAEELGLDPLELRLRNATRSGDVTPCGWKITSCGFEECFLRAVGATDWHAKRRAPKEGRWRRGIGMAGAIHVSGSNIFPDGEFSSIELKMFRDGQVALYKGSGDTGTWADTTLAQMVAEELDIPLDQIHVMGYDTLIAPASLGSFASRVCFEDGNAARLAAARLREYLLESASAHLGIPVDGLEARGGTIYAKTDETLKLSYGDAVFHSPRCVGHILTSEYQYNPPTERLKPDGSGNTSAAFAFSVQIAEVAVDTHTGEVQVERITVAQDVGKAINPLAVEGQIEGAVMQGIGYALSEELLTNSKGRMVSDTLEKYMMPTSMDIPEIKVILVETNDPEGPYGAKGVGEIGLNNTAPAIVNAIHDAIGVRFHRLPVRAEDVYFALKGGVPDA